MLLECLALAPLLGLEQKVELLVDRVERLRESLIDDAGQVRVDEVLWIECGRRGISRENGLLLASRRGDRCSENLLLGPPVQLLELGLLRAGDSNGAELDELGDILDFHRRLRLLTSAPPICSHPRDSLTGALDYRLIRVVVIRVLDLLGRLLVLELLVLDLVILTPIVGDAHAGAHGFGQIGRRVGELDRDVGHRGLLSCPRRGAGWFVQVAGSERGIASDSRRRPSA